MPKKVVSRSGLPTFRLRFTGDYSLGPIAFKLEIPGVPSLIFLTVMMTLFLMSFLEGARTGLAARVAGLLFAGSLFFIPLVAPLQGLRFAYGPALIVVGLMMVGSIQRIDFDDLTEPAPAFVTVSMMLFAYNVGNGLTAGLVVYPALKFAAGRGRELNPGTTLPAAMCPVYYLFGLPH